MSLKKINFGDKEVDKKKFYSSKEAILLDSVDFFLSISFIVSVQVRIFPLNMWDIIIYVAR